MKKLITIMLILATTMACEDRMEIEDCQCVKIRSLSKMKWSKGVLKLYYTEENREVVPCQPEKTWQEDNFQFQIKCK